MLGKRIAFGVLAVAAALSGCSTDAASVDEESSPAASSGDGRGTLVLDGDEVGFETDVCYQGLGTELSPDLRLDVEGTGVDGDGRAFRVQIVQTHAPTGELIDVIRVRYDDAPLGASLEAQRVHDPASGDVHDLWGDGSVPLLEVLRTDARLTVAATGATFGEYPGGGGDPAVVGTGDLRVTCTPEPG